MAFYRVILDNKVYVNPLLYKMANELGPSGLNRHIMDGETKQIGVLDDILLQVLPGKEKEYKRFVEKTEVQNVDEVLYNFTPCHAEDKASRVKIVRPKQLLEYRGYKFVRLSEADYPSRYHHKDRLALLQICGSYYVALGTRVKGIDFPVVLQLKNS